MKITICNDDWADVQPRQYVEGQYRTVTVHRGVETILSIETTDAEITVEKVVAGRLELVRS